MLVVSGAGRLIAAALGRLLYGSILEFGRELSVDLRVLFS